MNIFIKKCIPTKPKRRAGGNNEPTTTKANVYQHFYQTRQRETMENLVDLRSEKDSKISEGTSLEIKTGSFDTRK